MKKSYFAFNQSMMKYLYTTLLLVAMALASLYSSAQNAIGIWKDYLNYSRTIDVDVLNEKVYVANRNSIFIYDTDDNSLKRLNKVNALSDIGIISISSFAPLNTVYIGYANGNMDILSGNEVRNFADIKNSSVVGDKAIRHISYSGNTAFISTGVGILEFDMIKVEVSDTYGISPTGNLAINETAVLNDTLYAATDEGLYRGALHEDLTIFSNWEIDLSTPAPFEKVRNCTSYNGKLFVNIPTAPSPGLYARLEDNSWLGVNGSANIKSVKSNPQGLVLTTGYYVEIKSEDGLGPSVVINDYNGLSMSANTLIPDEKGVLWIADANKGLVKRNLDASFEFIAPDGPETNSAFDLDFKFDQLWVGTGEPKRPGTWNNTYKLDGFYSYIDGTWRGYTQSTNPELLDDLFFDVAKIYIDPDDKNQIYVGSFYSGLLSVKNQEFETLYNETNSTLGPWLGASRDDGMEWIGVAGIVKDGSDNLWVTNARTDSPLSVKTPEGSWKSFDLLGAEGLSTNKVLLDMLIDQQDQLWMIVNRGGIAVFDSGSSLTDESDDKVRLLTAEIGGGGLPTNEVQCITEDLDGEIWVGTTDGVAVFYSPFDALTNNFSDARRILVQQNGIYQYLLEGQAVSTIAIDGANRKWIGTFGAGVFLMSEDGTEQIQRFTSENSPLISNQINDIVIDDKTGEVFIATQEGIVSYISDATRGQRENNCTSVYPNPVREDYTGPISITGLLRDSQIRITDTRGNLIFKTVSNGGTAIWDGKNTDGQRVATGVYFALSSDTEGESTCVTKILVVK